MTNQNYGKKFEEIVKEGFKRIDNTRVIRLHDQTNGFLGSCNPCDFLVYHYPFHYEVECKTVHGNTLPLSNITKNQWEEMEKASNIQGCIAGVMCWWVDHDVTMFLPITFLNVYKREGKKSIRFDDTCPSFIKIPGKKKRVFFDYDFTVLFNL